MTDPTTQYLLILLRLARTDQRGASAVEYGASSASC